MLNPLGTSAVIGMFQGKLTHAGPVPTLTQDAAYGVSVAATAVAGVFLCILPTGTTDNDVLVTVGQFGGPPLEIDVIYASIGQSQVPLNGPNQRVTLAFKSGGVATDPVGLVNFVFYACADGINTTP